MLSIGYEADRYEHESIVALQEDYAKVLESVAADSTQRLSAMIG